MKDLFFNDKSIRGVFLGSSIARIHLEEEVYKAKGHISVHPIANILTYNGSAQLLCTSGLGSGIIVYSLDGITYNSTLPSQTNADTYTIYYKAVESGYYQESNIYTINTSITKANQSAPTATGATVDKGSTATATASGGGGQGSIEWSNGNTRTAGGSQTTQARWSGNANYNASPWSNSVTLTVNDPYNGYAYVDFGLPSGTKWATMNVGASSETDYGDYYKYGSGATAGASNSTYYSGTENPLDSSVDTAVQVWGGQWHMPTQTQYQELINECTWTWETSGGINGYTVSKNGKSIFLPAAGYVNNGNLYNVGWYGRYWSSTPNSDSRVYGLFFGSGGKNVGNDLRGCGFSVRPVVG